jgi:predicted anti-sigma-YlaC factor YlaD
MGNMDLVADLPTIEVMMRRVLELDPAYNGGAVHEFFITYEGSRGEAMGGDAAQARAHFEQAVAISKGSLASPYLALAESVAVAEQDAALFQELIGSALAVDADATPDARLLNTLSQRRARWLLDRMPELFLEYPEVEE